MAAFSSDHFTGNTLDPKWTWFPGSPATCTYSIQDSIISISIPGGTAFDNFTNGTNTQNVPSIKQTIDNTDFDIAVLYSDVPVDTNRGHGFMVNGPGTDAIRADLFHTSGDNISQFCISRVSASPTTHNNGQPAGGNWNQGFGGFPAWRRLRRVGDIWTIFASENGTTWSQISQFTRALTVVSVGITVLKASATGSYIGKIEKVVDLADQPDPRDSLQVTLPGQQWTTDFSAGVLPDWLTDNSVNSGLAIVTSGNLQLTTRSDIEASGGRVIFNAQQLANCDVLVRLRMQPKTDAETCFFVPGLSATGASIDGYSPGEAYIGEVNNGSSISRVLRVVRPVRTHYESPYTFLLTTNLAGWGTNIWLWARVRRVNRRIQVRYWVDGSPEPSAWAFDGEDNAVSWTSGAATGVPFLSWSHNPGVIVEPATHTMDVSSLTITSLDNAVDGYWGIENTQN